MDVLECADGGGEEQGGKVGVTVQSETGRKVKNAERDV